MPGTLGQPFTTTTILNLTAWEFQGGGTTMLMCFRPVVLTILTPNLGGHGHVSPWANALIAKANLRLQSRSQDAKEGEVKWSRAVLGHGQVQFGRSMETH